MKFLTRAVATAALCATALVGSTSTAGAAPPKLTPQQQQAVCVAQQTVQLLKDVDRKVWRTRAARDAAVKAAYEQAKKNCPLGGTTPQNPTQQYANLVVPAADEVVALGDGTYSFNDKRTLPPGAAPAGQTDGTPFLDVIRECPPGWTVVGDGLVDYANEANRGIVGFGIVPVDGQSYDSGQRYLLYRTSTAPLEPLGVTIRTICRPPAS